jgi:hypothetical protein
MYPQTLWFGAQSDIVLEVSKEKGFNLKLTATNALISVNPLYPVEGYSSIV